MISFFSVLFWVAIAHATANEIERRFIKAGLVDVQRIDKTIQVDLVNSDPKKNYFRKNFYNGLNKAYIRKAVAYKLAVAQCILKTRHPDYSLQILDAARPRSVSKMMYEKMKGTPYERFVANPQKGSMHNYGIAVDITIVDKNSKEIDMGFSPFRKNSMEIYWQFAKMKLGFDISKEQARNRRLLADTMKSAGFLPLRHEWWHFNGMPKDEARRAFSIIE